MIGQVIDSDTGSPVADAPVTVVWGPAGAPDMAALSDANGRFSLPSLSPGRWVLRAMAPGGAVGEGAVVVEIDHSEEIILKVSSRGGGSEFITDEVLGDIAPGAGADASDEQMAHEEAQAPNLFELTGADTQITHSSSSISGPPQFTYSGPKGAHSFSGDEIQTLRSALGTEITVTLEAVPDLHTITLTLLVPDISISLGEEHVFYTVGVFTTNGSTIAGPPPGAAQTYELTPLDGVARLVAF